MSTGIKHISAREILDSRGKPTLSVRVETDFGFGSFAVPSGASTGAHEAKELRDGGSGFGGFGVSSAVRNVNDIIAPVLLQMDVLDQRAVDDRLAELDGTPDFSRLGGNAVVGVSIAVAKAAAQSSGVELWRYLRSLGSISPSRAMPFLYMNVINGGKHAGTRLPFQEYHIVPQTEDIGEALEIGTAVFRELREILRERFGPMAENAGDEGGCAPDIADPRVPLEFLYSALLKTPYESKVKFAFDVAASSFYNGFHYDILGKSISQEELTALYKEISAKYPILSIEDPFHEEAFTDFATLNSAGVMVVGDDLTTTNVERIKRAVEVHAISGVIIKPNQIGTLTATLSAMQIARENNIECIVSHRSGETDDTFIADLAYAFGVFGIKAGAPREEERVIKYNRLWDIARGIS